MQCLFNSRFFQSVFYLQPKKSIHMRIGPLHEDISTLAHRYILIYSQLKMYIFLFYIFSIGIMI